MTAALTELSHVAELATAERQTAEACERAALFAAEGERSAAKASAQRRVELVGVLADAQAAEDACRDRLGSARLQHAATQRQLEDAADRAAAGDDPAAKSVVRLQDTEGLQGSLVLAHERQTRKAVGVREAAERELLDHDALGAARTGAALEEAILAAAGRVDELLQQVAAVVALVGDLAEARRQVAADAGAILRESWPIKLARQNTRHEAALLAAYTAFGPLEATFQALGVQHRGEPLATGARELLGAWAQGRRPADKAA